MRVLGIESSCDETGIAIYDGERGLLAHEIYSQIDLHRAYGGVVPELASRDHMTHFIALVEMVLARAGLEKQQLDAIAYTAGPGLVGALLAGSVFAKSLAFGLGIPSIAVHHLEAHVLAAQLDTSTLTFPFLALLVSGGHTQLIDVRGLGSYQIIGETLDDAVGEAFDKTAKLMGIPYPGGATLATLADSTDVLTSAPFPRPMLDKPGLNFSFSGLKTHAVMAWKNSEQNDAARVSIAYAFQAAVVDTLLNKCQRALAYTKHKRLVVAGGVGANRALRRALQNMVHNLNVEVYFPRLEFCTDNGAMIAYAGFLHLNNGECDIDQSVRVRARWDLPSRDCK